MIASPRRRFVVFLDTTLLVIFMMLLSPRLTGLALHEILGFIFFIPLMIHLLIAWPWIQNASKKFFGNVNRRTRFNFFLNSILFIIVITELVSGLLISQVVLQKVGINTINDEAWRAVHNLPLNFLVLFAGLHIAMNWGWIVGAFKWKRDNLKLKQKVFYPKWTVTLMRIGMIILATGIVFLLLYTTVGEPSLSRLDSQNEIARFAPSLGHGIIQLSGETILIFLVVFIARKWLHVKL